MSVWMHLFDPRQVFHQYFLHWLVCAFIPGAYFHDSLIAANKDPIMKRMAINNTQFGFLFSIAAITAVVVGPAGVIMAKIGTRVSALLCGFLCFFGSVIVYFGILKQSYATLVFGRFLFWLFLWLLQVVQNILTYRNFQGRRLAVAYGLLVTSCRFGGTLGYSLNAPLTQFFEGSLNPLADTVFVSVMAVLACFAATVGFTLLSSTKLARQARRESTSPVVTPELSFGSIAKLPKVCLFLYLQIGCLYAAIFPFEAFGVPLLDETYHISENRATLLLSIVPSISLLAPLIATFFRGIDNQATLFGKKLSILNIGWSCIILTFIIMCFPTLDVPFLWMTLLGTGYALNATVCWIMVPDLVKSDLERLSVALCYVALGVAMFVSNLMTGILRDHLNNDAVLIWFMTLGFGGMACAYGIGVNYAAEAQTQGDENDNDRDDADLLDRTMASSLDQIAREEAAGFVPQDDACFAFHEASSAPTEQEVAQSACNNVNNPATDDTPGVKTLNSPAEHAPCNAVDVMQRINSKSSRTWEKAGAVSQSEEDVDSRNASKTNPRVQVVATFDDKDKDTQGSDIGGRNRMTSLHIELEAAPATVQENDMRACTRASSQTKAGVSRRKCASKNAVLSSWSHSQHADASSIDTAIPAASAPSEKMTSTVGDGRKDDK